MVMVIVLVCCRMKHKQLQGPQKLPPSRAAPPTAIAGQTRKQQQQQRLPQDGSKSACRSFGASTCRARLSSLRQR